jgi:hypothetical protein
MTNHATLPTITKNKAQTTKYNIIFIKGYIILLYKLLANCIQLGIYLSEGLANSFVIIPLSQTKDVARNLAETMIIIHNTPKATNLIHSFNVSSLSDIIIL